MIRLRVLLLEMTRANFIPRPVVEADLGHIPSTTSVLLDIVHQGSVDEGGVGEGEALLQAIDDDTRGWSARLDVGVGDAYSK